MNFTTWLDTFISEKEIDLERTFEIEDPITGWNFIPVGSVIEHMKIAGIVEQMRIKSTFVKIDFANGDPYHFIEYLAKALVAIRSGSALYNVFEGK
jgi:hypothetical protein